jgi:hypothetical protein
MMAATIDEDGSRVKNKRCMMKIGQWVFCQEQELRLEWGKIAAPGSRD